MSMSERDIWSRGQLVQETSGPGTAGPGDSWSRGHLVQGQLVQGTAGPGDIWSSDNRQPNKWENCNSDLYVGRACMS